MILSGIAIKKAMARGNIAIDPFVEDQIEQAHVNLHLGEMTGMGEVALVAPKAFVLARTLEKVTLPANICGLIEGRASLAKRGISVEQSSKFIEPGSNNQMVLEIFNASDQPVELKIGQPIAKMLLCHITDDIE